MKNPHRLKFSLVQSRWNTDSVLPHGGFLAVVACCLVLYGLSLSATLLGAEAGAIHAAAATVTASDLLRHVQVLADDSLEGRAAGSRGGYAAGTYLAGRFHQYGLEPAGDSGAYFQIFQSGYRNVLGLLPGKDPQLKNELILIAAHYDHVGYGTRANSFGPIGYIHNGADDNASGVAAVLELAEACVQAGIPLRRSVLFALWDAEEKGMLGSYYWLQHPTVSHQRIAAMINLDMIGRLRNNRLEVYGSRTAAGLRQTVVWANHTSQLTLDFPWEMKANSDHYPFFVQRIPTLMFHTGLHEDYHRPTDDTEKINVEGMQQVVRLILEVMISLADQEHRLEFRPEALQEGVDEQRAFERLPPPAPGRLGIRWQWSQMLSDDVALVGANDTMSGLSQGVQITEVLPDSPAGRQGLKVGQWIVAVNDQPLQSPHDFLRCVFPGNDHLELRVLDPAEKSVRRVQVPPHFPPMRVGISWRSSTAEPGVFYLITVIPGSPADLAGLHPGDRLYAVNGRTIFSSEELQRVFAELVGSTEVLIERRGQLITRILELP
jgi:hypothetical protein